MQRTIYILSLEGVKHDGFLPDEPKIATRKGKVWASLVVQWLRIHLPMQGTQVLSLVQEDLTCHGATKLEAHSY